MTPIEKNIIVVDEQGNTLEATYPKRAKGLVKKGRARFISGNVICLACPPEKLEENAMSNNVSNIDLVIENLVAAETERTEKELKEYKEKLQTVHEKYFAAALALVVEKRSCATSLLQRKLKVGYGTAAMLIDLMEALELVTPFQTVKKTRAAGRQVLPAATEYLDHLPTKD
jgi:DNA segregation ATPase FtsK/SpoIIIE-like protein